ncbi:hypothetical protein J2S36_000682 [Arcanobacterium hippocoleae]|uniref:Uncharacterized protein n=1 Tax=Arcanobacterium hippocoleae TaxID=149017 RepID=A0ABU1T1G3_9ACTO|nr:hypothetical protein [Arcanobacterium hippocoleae]
MVLSRVIVPFFGLVFFGFVDGVFGEEFIAIFSGVAGAGMDGLKGS